MPISDYNKKKKLDVDSISGTPTVGKAQLIEIAGGLIEQDGFEDGDFSSSPTWTETASNGTATVQGTTVKNGSNALEMSTSGSGNETLTHDRGTGSDTVDDGQVYQFWFRVGTAADEKFFVGLSNSSGDPLGNDGISVTIQSDGDVNLNIRDSTGSFAEASKVGTYSADSWFRAELKVVPSQTKAAVKLYDSNGGLVGQATSTSTSGATDLQYMTMQHNDNAQRNVYVDDISYSTTEVSESETGNGKIWLDFANIADAQDIAVYDESGNLLDYEIESLDTTAETGVLWAYNSWVRDGSTQAQVAYGSNSANEDRSMDGTGANPWGNGQKVLESFRLNGNAADSSPNNNDGTVNGPTSTTGQFDGALSFDNTDDYITLQDIAGHDIADGTSITILASVNANNTSSNNTVFEFRNRSTFEGYALRMDTSNDWRIEAGDGSDGGNDFGTNLGSWSTDTDYNIAYIFDNANDEVVLYKNSSLEVTHSLGADYQDITADSAPRIGYLNDDSYPFGGIISDFIFYNGRKSPEFIQAHHDASPKAGQVFFSQQAAETTVSTKEVSTTHDTALKNLGAETATTHDTALQIQDRETSATEDTAIQNADIEVSTTHDTVIEDFKQVTTTHDVALKNLDAETKATLDAAIQESDLEATLTEDAVLMKQSEVSTAHDTVLQNLGAEKNAVVDAALKKLDRETSLDIDSVVQDADIEVSTTHDTVLKGTGFEVSTTHDAVLKTLDISAKGAWDTAIKSLGKETTFAVDTAIQGQSSKLLTEDTYIAHGRPGAVTVYIDGTEYKKYANIKVKKRLNEMNDIEFEAFIEDSNDRSLLQEGATVEIFEGADNLLFKGRLNNVEYESNFRAKCEGFGQEVKLLNRKTPRVEYDNTGADNIVKQLVTTEIMNEGTIENAPLVSLRFDHDNKLRAIAGAANAVGYDWYVSQKKSEGYDKDYLNFVERKGSSTSQKTYDIGNNARMVERNKDTEHIANDITMLGRGDGINQLEANVFAASTHRTVTAERLKDTDTTSLDVKDASQLGADGDTVHVRVGTEVIEGTLDVTNDQIDISTRGANDYNGNSTEVITHYKDIQVWLQENVTQGLGPFKPTKSGAEAGSSIDSFGVREEKVTDRTVINKSTLEKVADNELKDRRQDIFRVQIKPTDPRTTKNIELGDDVTAKDLTAMDVNNEFRVVGMDINRASGAEGTVLHLANRPLRLTERLRDIKRSTDTTSTHMQGATNIDSQNFGDNCDNSHPLKTELRIPEDAVAVNKAEIAFSREPFRGYVKNESHTHNVTSTTETSASSSTGEYPNYLFLNVSENVSILNPFVFTSVPGSPTGKFVGANITYSVFNKSGSTKDYDLELKNTTTGNILDTRTVSINDDAGKSFNISTGENGSIAALSHDDTTSFSTGDEKAIRFSGDGKKMFLIDNTEVREYDLSTAWESDSASLTNTFDTSGEDNFMKGGDFNNDGTKLFLLGSENDNIYEYNLSTAYDTTTMSLNTTYSFKDKTALYFGKSGRKMYQVELGSGSNQNSIYEYDLSTAYDPGTASLNNIFDPSDADKPRSVAFSKNGERMQVLDIVNDYVYEYKLGVAWDVSTAGLSTIHTENQDDSPFGVTWGDSESDFYVYIMSSVEQYKVVGANMSANDSLRVKILGSSTDDALETASGSSDSYMSLFVSSKSQHTHNVTVSGQTAEAGGTPTYQIFEPTSEPDIDVEVIVDNNSVTTINDVSVGQTVNPIDIKSELSEPIAGNYHSIEVKPVDTGGGNNGRSRLNATVFSKVFVESKL